MVVGLPTVPFPTRDPLRLWGRTPPLSGGERPQGGSNSSSFLVSPSEHTPSVWSGSNGITSIRFLNHFLYPPFSLPPSCELNCPKYEVLDRMSSGIYKTYKQITVNFPRERSRATAFHAAARSSGRPSSARAPHFSQLLRFASWLTYRLHTHLMRRPPLAFPGPAEEGNAPCVAMRWGLGRRARGHCPRPRPPHPGNMKGPPHGWLSNCVFQP